MKIRTCKQGFSWLLASLLLLSTQSWAESSVHYHFSGGYYGEPGSGEAMVFDAVLVRPIGLVTTVAGSAIIPSVMFFYSFFSMVLDSPPALICKRQK